MSDPDKRPRDGEDDGADSVLRAKYHDYCSARVADTLLQLTPDEIFVMAQEAARAVGGRGEVPYGRAVRLATATISRTLNLPPFEAWLDDYRTNPEKYERYFIGLWEGETGDGA